MTQRLVTAIKYSYTEQIFPAEILKFRIEKMKEKFFLQTFMNVEMGHKVKGARDSECTQCI